MTNTMQDIADHAQAIFIIGSNTSEQHPVFSYKIRQAVLQRDIQLVVADPRKIPITDHATLHIQHKPGTDIALVNGLMHIILNNDWHDKQFIKERCEGFEEFAESLEKYTPSYVSKETGVQVDQIEQAAEILSKNSPMSILWAMGITQHTTGVMNVFSLANLQMLLGNMGVKGGGTNPLRGQNNVQGACDLGALVNVFPGYQQVVDPEVRKKFNAAWQLEKDGWKPDQEITPLFGDKPGLTVTEVTSGAKSGQIRAMFIVGENPIMSDPDTNHVRECFEACEFVVLQEIFPSETSQYADVLLPGASFAEKNGTFTNTERRIQLVRQAIAPKGESRPDWEIISALANRVIAIEERQPIGPHAGWGYQSPEEIMDEIAQVSPIYGGVSHKRLEKGSQFHWPVLDQKHPGTPILHVGQFSRGKGKFNISEHIPSKELPDKNYPFFLTTGRVLYHWHGAEMTRRVDGLVEIYPESLIELNPVDATRLGIEEKDKIKIRSRRGEMVAKASVTDRVAEGVIFGNFHFPGEQNVNNLTILALDPTAKIPEYKVCAVSVELAR
jgi:formate dehydrogenase major subunit/formate dehydrogenase alpha subunit